MSYSTAEQVPEANQNTKAKPNGTQRIIGCSCQCPWQGI